MKKALTKKQQDKKDLEEFLKMVREKRISPFHMRTIRQYCSLTKLNKYEHGSVFKIHPDGGL